MLVPTELDHLAAQDRDLVSKREDLEIALTFRLGAENGHADCQPHQRIQGRQEHEPGR